MKLISTLTRLMAVVFILAATQTFAQKYTYSDSWSKAVISIDNSKSTGVELNFSLSHFEFTDFTLQGESMKDIMMPEAFIPADEGHPNLPSVSRFIAIPQGSTPILKVKSSRVEKFSNMMIAPAPRIPLDNDVSPLYYAKNPQVYSKNEFINEEPALMSDIMQIRGVDVVQIAYMPFSYNPVTKEMKVYRDVKIEIEFKGGNGQFGEERLRSRHWEPILEDALLNYTQIQQVDFDARVQQQQNADVTGAEYLIITPTGASYLQWADSIGIWRNQQGISTIIKTLTDVGGNTTTAIKNYLTTAYNTWTIPPAACLLLGDYGTDATMNVISPIYNNYCVSDNIFGDINNDQLPDIVMARITANNATQLQVMISKGLKYERTPPTSPVFYNKPITALGWQTERWFQICSETIGGYFANVHGKQPTRINEIYSGTPGTIWSTATNTSTVVNYFGPSGLGYIPASPATLGNWAGGNATMINNAMNQGSFLLQHRDHGMETGWGEPYYTNTNINGLTNTDLTFIMSINCLTGKYNYGSECFTEKFHRYTYGGQNSGALALIGASEVSYSFVNDTYVWGMYDNMWPDFMPAYGSTPGSRGLCPAFGNAAGKYFLQQSSWPYNTSNKEVTYHLFHMHGDAFLKLFSVVPQNLTVSHSPTINIGATTFAVTANAGAIICISRNNQILATATATGSLVNITIPAQVTTGTLLVTVTMQNYRRYKANVTIQNPAGPVPVINFTTNQTNVCTGITVNYTDNSTNSPTAWSWSFPGGTPATSNLQNPTVVYSTLGTYDVSLLATNSYGSGYGSTASYINVTTTPSAPAAPTGPSSLCLNPINGNYVTSGSTGATSYTWTLTPASAGVLTPNILNAVVDWSNTFTGTATINVQATNACGVSAPSLNLNVAINTVPTTPSTPTGPAIICQNTGTSDYTTGTVTGASSYTWELSPSNAGTISGNWTQGTVVWSASFSGVAEVKVKATNECGISAFSTAYQTTINPLPTPYNVTGGGSYCAGGNGLEIGLENSQINTTYSLELNGISTGSTIMGSGSAISFGNQSNFGNYSVIGTYSGCVGSMNGSTAVSIMPLPGTPAQPTGPALVQIPEIQSSEYSTTGALTAANYSWSIEPPSAGNIVGNNLTSTVTWDLLFMGNASIKVKAINQCGESELSEAFAVVIENSVGIVQPSNIGFNIFPNPTDGSITITAQTNAGIFKLQIRNSLGALVFDKKISTEGSLNLLLDLHNLDKGVYLVQLQSDNQSYYQRLIIR